MSSEMVAANPVLIDTCLWIPFFNRKPSTEKSAVTELVKSDRAVLIGPILAEVLHGFRRNEHADWAASLLDGVSYVDLTWSHWKSAARIGRELARNEHRLPLADLTLAAVALQNEWLVYSTDPHFDLVPNLKRFYPE